MIARRECGAATRVGSAAEPRSGPRRLLCRVGRHAFDDRVLRDRPFSPLVAAIWQAAGVSPKLGAGQDVCYGHSARLPFYRFPSNSAICCFNFAAARWFNGTMRKTAMTNDAN